MASGSVFFDCDSTLVRVEGIDELAVRAGAGEAIASLTREAMEGRLALEDVYGRRIALVRPDRAALAWLGVRYFETLVEGAAEVVAALHAADYAVHVVSGGLLEPVRAVAARLGIPERRVHAVPVELGAGGEYAGFDPACRLARSGGKAVVVREALVGERGRSIMIGDGVTDMELVGTCDVVIGFGGVVARDAVRAAADVFVAGPSLFGVLAAALPSEQLAGLESGPHAPTVRRARRELGVILP